VRLFLGQIQDSLQFREASWLSTRRWRPVEPIRKSVVEGLARFRLDGHRNETDRRAHQRP
jgi:hypothetical protein